jgi:hypothetical protein
MNKIIKPNAPGERAKYYNPWTGEYVGIKSLRKDLKLRGRDDQWYYDTQVLGLESNPKCLYCEESRKFLGILAGYRKTCGKKECVSRSKSESEIRTFRENPEIRIESTKKGKATRAARTPERRREVGDHIREGQKPILKERGRKISIALNTPESQKRARNSRRKMWKNPSDKLLSTTKNSKRGKKLKIFSEYESKIISLDSNLEKTFYEWSRTKSFVVNLVRNKTISIPYFVKGESLELEPHNYYPDWIMTLDSGDIVIVEVKPKCLLDDDIVKAKSSAAIKYCKSEGYHYYVYTEDMDNPIIYC